MSLDHIRMKPATGLSNNSIAPNTCGLYLILIGPYSSVKAHVTQVPADLALDNAHHVIKYGKSDDIKKRLREHRHTFGKQSALLHHTVCPKAICYQVESLFGKAAAPYRLPCLYKDRRQNEWIAVPAAALPPIKQLLDDIVAANASIMAKYECKPVRVADVGVAEVAAVDVSDSTGTSDSDDSYGDTSDADELPESMDRMALFRGILDKARRNVHDGQPDAANNALMTMAKRDKTPEHLDRLLEDPAAMKAWFPCGVDDVSAARLFFHLHPDKYMYDQAKNIFYTVNEHNIWQVDTNAAFLKTELDAMLHSIRAHCAKASLHEQHAKLVKYLDRSKSRAEIVKAFKCHCKNNMHERADANRHLFAFRNGVYDVQNRAFRLPLPNEYVVLTNGHAYEPLNDRLTALMNNLQHAIGNVLDKEEVAYMLASVAQSLVGLGHRNEFHVWQGTGRGKEVVKQLVRRTFGAYCGTLDSAYVASSKRIDVRATPESLWKRMQHCRIAFTTELKSDCELRMGQIRSLTEYGLMPQCRFFIQTHHKVRVDTVHACDLGKFKVQQFRGNEPLSDSERLAIAHLEELSSPDCAIAFFHLLLKHYCADDDGRLAEPPSVKNETRRLMAANDQVAAFVDARIVRTQNSNDRIRESIVSEQFTKFHGGNVTLPPTQLWLLMRSRGIQGVMCRGTNYYEKVRLKEATVGDRGLL